MQVWTGEKGASHTVPSWLWLVTIEETLRQGVTVF